MKKLLNINILIATIAVFLSAVLISSCQEPPPEAGFSIDKESGQVPFEVNLLNQSLNADEFQWDLGDGTIITTTSLQEIITHEYHKVGQYIVTLTASQGDDQPLLSKVSKTIEVKAGNLHSIRISPVAIAAGESRQLEVVMLDEYDNEVTSADIVWTVTNEVAGTVTMSGLFEASEIAKSYGDILGVVNTQGEISRQAITAVTVIPNSLDQVVIAPEKVNLGLGMTQQFIAVGADKYGNHISDLDFSWMVENGGTVTADGLFTAGNDPNVYADNVKVEVTQDGTTKSCTASVTVEPDRIAFRSYDDQQADLYIMNIDGSNLERLTYTPSLEFKCSWSPDGRRIVYDSYNIDDGLIVMNDDGDRKLLLHSNRSSLASVYAEWSPLGNKITFVKLNPNDWGNMDIFVIDVDGGNVTQLTDTDNGTEWVPTWSPDGAKIVYDFTPEGREGDIYVMDADGTDSERLTTDPANDTGPVWSPDGAQIVFVSTRDGDADIYIMDADGSNLQQLTFNRGANDVDPAWSPDGTKIVFASDMDEDDQYEIYIMDADGNNITRLTDNSIIDDRPVWAPRKSGILVTEDSVVISGTSRVKAMTVEEVTTKARHAVVHIETDLGSGSGFVIGPDGYIMTNNHVISDAGEIMVYLDDGASYEATVYARDLVRDLAIIKIDATELSFLIMGDLSTVSLGQQIVVLGYPLDVDTITVTSGFASATDFDPGRNILWIQTDSAINPGNSGGPILNLQGEVIGIVSAKIVGLGVEGVGFAISANTVNTYLPRLMAGQTIITF